MFVISEQNILQLSYGASAPAASPREPPENLSPRGVFSGKTLLKFAPCPTGWAFAGPCPPRPLAPLSKPPQAPLGLLPGPVGPQASLGILGPPRAGARAQMFKVYSGKTLLKFATCLAGWALAGPHVAEIRRARQFSLVSLSRISTMGSGTCQGPGTQKNS